MSYYRTYHSEFYSIEDQISKAFSLIIVLHAELSGNDQLI